jgi:glycine betaine/proline transport system substrate-binding protein
MKKTRLHRPQPPGPRLRRLRRGAQAANDLPGKGVTVQPLKSSLAEEAFQTLLVMRALEKLGYTVEPMKDLEPATEHLAIANGDATFMANHWSLLHADFYKNSGGDAKLSRTGVYSDGAVQGYLIDRKTAEQYNITSIAQLKDPAIAKLFDADGDGKADLTGCNPGWGCELAIENHLTAYQLRDTVTHKQGSYAALMADTIARFKQDKPVLYYTWTPYWVSAVLRPGADVVWLQVPFSSSQEGQARHAVAERQELRLPGQPGADRRQQGLRREEPGCGQAVRGDEAAHRRHQRPEPAHEPGRQYAAGRGAPYGRLDPGASAAVRRLDRRSAGCCEVALRVAGGG